jgi:hypothetical protein
MAQTQEWLKHRETRMGITPTGESTLILLELKKNRYLLIARIKKILLIRTG